MIVGSTPSVGTRLINTRIISSFNFVLVSHLMRRKINWHYLKKKILERSIITSENYIELTDNKLIDFK